MRYKRRFFIVATLMATVGATLFFGAQAFDLVRYQLPKKALHFEELKPPTAVALLDRNDRVLSYVYGEKLYLYRPLSQISPKLADFVTISEDDKFYFHKGFDVEEIKNSIHEDFEKGKRKRGGSTISQQLAKNLFLDKEKSLIRKIYEVPWTLRLEKDLKKRQILELYLNVIEWGPGIYGAEAASRHFFDRPASELDIGQALYLTLIIPNPKRFDVFQNPKARSFIEEKRRWLVDRLVNEKKIDPSQLEAYKTASMDPVPPDAEDRHFAVSHEGNYFGNRFQKNPSLQLLESKLSLLQKRSADKKNIKLSLDKDVWDALQSAKEIDDPEADHDRFVAIISDEHIWAFRQVKKGRGLDMTEVEDLLQSSEEDGEAEDLDQIPWTSLVL